MTSAKGSRIPVAAALVIGLAGGAGVTQVLDGTKTAVAVETAGEVASSLLRGSGPAAPSAESLRAATIEDHRSLDHYGNEAVPVFD